MKNLYPNRKSPSHEENISLANRFREGDKRAREKLVEANAGLAYNNALRYSKMNSGRGQICEEDLLSAAFIGLIEAVDRYDPDKGYKFVTYAHWWINKRISEEISIQHWNTVKPPSGLSRAYLYKNMSEDENEDYVRMFMQFDEVEKDHNWIVEDEKVDSGLILSYASDCDFSILEDLVFSWLFDPRFPSASVNMVARELGMKRVEVEEVAEQCLEKIRSKMGLPSQNTL